jgi:transcriptional regulator with PAS, ATPase and Fis domain
METFFECSQCGAKFDHYSFSQIAETYGLILLRRAKDGLFGSMCPNCKKISLRRENKELIKSEVLPLLLNDFVFDESTFLYYDSFPYELAQPTLKIPAPTFLKTKALFPDERSLDEAGVGHSDDQAYCSYGAGDEAMGPAMTVYWFKEDDISDLIRIENESGTRIFPRYAPYYDRLCVAMVNYCYEQRLELDLVASQFIENIEPFLVNLKNEVNPWQKSIGENYELLKILSTSHRDPQDALLEYTGKNSIPVPETLFREYEERYKREGEAGLAKILEEWAEEPETPEVKVDTRDHQRPPSPEDWPSYERMSEIIWSRFHDPHVQDLLSRMSTKLINKYIESAARTDFNRELAWKLKDEYLQDLYKAVISPAAATLFTQELDEEEFKAVREAEARFPGAKITSKDSRINEIKIRLSKIARIEKRGLSILILGESGTGKELFAKAFHEATARKGKLVTFDCGARSETLFESELFGHVKGAYTGAMRDKKGAFELADGGSIFLDEIGNLPLHLQARMLRVLQEQEVQRLGADHPKKLDVKIVLATNKDLAKMVEEGRFMPDLYERFKGTRFVIPPLRERKGDIPLLVEHFIKKHDVRRIKDPSLAPIRLTPKCIELLIKYEWRGGNARELENVISDIMLDRYDSRRDITPADLPPEIAQTKGGGEKQFQPIKNLPGNQKITDEQIADAMKRLNNQSQAARELGVSIKTIQRRWKSIAHL